MSKRKQLSDLTIAELLALYAELGVAQNAAESRGQIVRFNRLAGHGWRICDELAKRPGDQRIALMKFYDHPDIQVRYNAARDTWRVANIEARRKLEEIRDLKWYPQCAEAAMQIRIFDGTACLPPESRNE